MIASISLEYTRNSPFFEDLDDPELDQLLHASIEEVSLRLHIDDVSQFAYQISQFRFPNKDTYRSKRSFPDGDK